MIIYSYAILRVQGWCGNAAAYITTSSSIRVDREDDMAGTMAAEIDAAIAAGYHGHGLGGRWLVAGALDLVIRSSGEDFLPV